MDRCAATRADGQPCSGRARPSGYCFAHDPALQEKRQAANAEGGRNKASIKRLERRMPADLRPILDLLYAGLVELREGELEPRVATAMAGMASAIARIHEVATVQGQLDALAGVLEPERKRQVGR